MKHFFSLYLKIYNKQNEQWIRLQYWTNFTNKNQNWKSLLKLCRVTKFSYHIPTAVLNVLCLCGIKIQLAMNKISPNAKFTRWLLWFIGINEIETFESIDYQFSFFSFRLSIFKKFIGILLHITNSIFMVLATNYVNQKSFKLTKWCWNSPFFICRWTVK